MRRSLIVLVLLFGCSCEPSRPARAPSSLVQEPRVELSLNGDWLRGDASGQRWHTTRVPEFYLDAAQGVARFRLDFWLRLYSGCRPSGRGNLALCGGRRTTRPFAFTDCPRPRTPGRSADLLIHGSTQYPAMHRLRESEEPAQTRTARLGSRFPPRVGIRFSRKTTRAGILSR
jgi:hypothetical protein